MKPENAEHVGVDCDLSECSMDAAVYKILPKIGEPHLFTLKVHQHEKFQAIRLANNACYPAIVIVDTEHYPEDFEWSLTGEGSLGTHCVWSPGA